MLCQNCNEREANVKYTQIVNGVKKQMNLCDECAQKLGIDVTSFSMPIDFSNFLGGFNDIFEDNLETFMPTFSLPQTLKCDKCNMTYDEFLQTGKFGCDECYNTFHTKIDNLLKNIHGVNRHIGRNGRMLGKAQETNSKANENKQTNTENTQSTKKVTAKKKESKEEKIEELQARLKQEIKEERYEDAAKTRDEIKKLENKEGK